jgi:pimeloyl-ACP methyl ester carboxylesterase
LQVVRYDFLGHGWSQAKDKWIKYTNEIFVSQLEDLIGHIMTGKSKEVALFCGHSTGGLVGILACEQLKHKFTIKDLVLVSPALWKEAPLIVKIGDRMPGIMWNLLSSRPLRFLHLPKGTYLENCDSAFGKDPGTRQFTYPGSTVVPLL